MKKPKSTTRAKSKKTPEPDVNQHAHYLVQMMTQNTEPSKPVQAVVVLPSPTDAEISRVMAELGRRGGKIGGRKRAEKLTKKKRHQIAVAAAKARWALKNEQKAN